MPDPRDAAVLRTQILSFLESHPERAYRAKEISRVLGIKNQGRFQALLEAFDALRDSGEAAYVGSGRLQHRTTDGDVEGVLSVSPQGFGFVKTDDGTEYFVRPRMMRTAEDPRTKTP